MYQTSSNTLGTVAHTGLQSERRRILKGTIQTSGIRRRIWQHMRNKKLSCYALCQ